jgi:hypothetical protein
MTSGNHFPGSLTTPFWVRKIAFRGGFLRPFVTVTCV